MVLSELYVQPTLSSVLKSMAEVALKAIPKDFDHLINLAEFNRCQEKKSEIKLLLFGTSWGTKTQPDFSYVSKKLEKYNFDVVFVFIHAPVSICIKFNETKDDSIVKGHCKAYPNYWLISFSPKK